MGDTLLGIIAAVAMVAVLFFSLLPFIPGALLLWVISFAYAYLTDFRYVSTLAIGIISAITLASVFRDFWMPLIGMKTRGASCSSTFGSMVGGIIGTFLIPIPLIGSLIGAVAGAVIMEFVRAGSIENTTNAASFATQTFVYSLIAEFVLNIVIVAVFFLSLLIG